MLMSPKQYYYYYLGVVQMDKREYDLLKDVLNNIPACKYIKVKRLKEMLHTYELRF